MSVIITGGSFSNPEKFVAKVKNDLGIGDAMDQAIRDLLGDV